MLQLRNTQISHLNSDRKHSSSTLSEQKSSSIDTNSSNDNKISLSEELYFYPYFKGPSCNFAYRNNQANIASIVGLNKQKSQLCRKFMQIGVCPYGYKCKFAHGAHELRQNQHANNRYKTKQCVTFFKEGFCRFGNRCNFLHIKSNNQQQKRQTLVKIMCNYRQCIHEMREKSRLLQLLQSDQQ